LVKQRKQAMKETWNKPEVKEQEVGLEVTSYIAAEIAED
jgi:coenzyme PQQ precursor peptide PqqA